MLAIYTYKNDVFREPEKEERAEFCSSSAKKNLDGLGLVAALRGLGRDTIIEKKFGDISSFNFSREVFNSGKWNDLSKIARGLFINTKTGEIVARGYEKFFAHNERAFNSDRFLKDNIQYPVQVYEKYNGFLGIIGIFEGKLLFCTKSIVGGEYGSYMKSIFDEVVKPSMNWTEDFLAEWLDKNKKCLVFEVVDPKNDPHIVKYSKPKMVLLDVIDRTREFKTLPYRELKTFAESAGFACKEKCNIINDFETLKNEMEKLESSDEPQREGCVFVDASGYHVKVKTRWYKDWKYLRGFIPKIANRRGYSTSGLRTPEMNYFIDFLKKKDPEELMAKSLVQLRDEFFEESKGGI